MNKTKGCLIANFATVPTAEIDWNYTSWSRRCRKILIGLVVRGAKTVVVRGKNRILTQNREKLEMTVPIS
uniref:hypothetical protein n=2 Tax=Escherichia coli TaxID=562 RepID=UPI00202CD46A|nr:hypothetical protein [Escherichia coli]